MLVHPEVRAWMRTLDEKTMAGVVAAIDALGVYGPTLQRPLAERRFAEHVAALEGRDNKR